MDTKLPPDDDQLFRSWYSAYAADNGLGDDPDDPLNPYDYRAWWMAMNRDYKKNAPQMSDDGIAIPPSKFMKSESKRNYEFNVQGAGGKYFGQSYTSIAPSVARNFNLGNLDLRGEYGRNYGSVPYETVSVDARYKIDKNQELKAGYRRMFGGADDNILNLMYLRRFK